MGTVSTPPQRSAASRYPYTDPLEPRRSSTAAPRSIPNDSKCSSVVRLGLNVSVSWETPAKPIRMRVLRSAVSTSPIAPYFVNLEQLFVYNETLPDRKRERA